MAFSNTELAPHEAYLSSALRLASVFDHTQLHPSVGTAQISKLCDEAAKYRFATVCVAPRWTSLAAIKLSELNSSAVGVCTVIGFPHGNTTTQSKVFEAAQALSDGAAELDMVISIGDLKAGRLDAVRHDISEVVEAARRREGKVKVILETGYLTSAEIASACELAESAGANFVKTSTGFARTDDPLVLGPVNADPKIVRFMRESVGPAVQIKASGGIKTLADARALLKAGATRLGSSSSVRIIEEYRETKGGEHGKERDSRSRR